jgi:hypothetical protein
MYKNSVKNSLKHDQAGGVMRGPCVRYQANQRLRRL